MNIKKNIGKRIKELRKKSKLSQEQLAEIINVAQNTLSEIENGNNFFTADTLEKIITSLEIEPEELFNFSHYKEQDELLQEINTMLTQNPDKITDVYKIVRALVK